MLINNLYRQKPVVVEAVHWFKNGDHPMDGDPSTEGNVVRYFRDPATHGTGFCELCAKSMHNHGWIDQGWGLPVCPGDWVVSGEDEGYKVYKPVAFNAKYSKVR